MSKLFILRLFKPFGTVMQCAMFNFVRDFRLAAFSIIWHTQLVKEACNFTPALLYFLLLSQSVSAGQWDFP